MKDVESHELFCKKKKKKKNIYIYIYIYNNRKAMKWQLFITLFSLIGCTAWNTTIWPLLLWLKAILPGFFPPEPRFRFQNGGCVKSAYTLIKLKRETWSHDKNVPVGIFPKHVKYVPISRLHIPPCMSQQKWTIEMVKHRFHTQWLQLHVSLSTS